MSEAAPAHFAYVATGEDDNQTVAANRLVFSKHQLRAPRLVDFSRLDTSVRLFEEGWPSPISLSPVSSQASMHAAGELATAQASRKTQTLQMHSTFSSRTIEDVNEVYDRPVWFQIYAANAWQTTLKMIRRAENAGCKTMVFTVDMFGGSNRNMFERYRRLDTRDCNRHVGAQFNSKPLKKDIHYQIAGSRGRDYL